MIRIPGKIPITIRPLFWLIAFLIGWLFSFKIVWALLAIFVIFFSVLLHEYGHALTALFFGQKTRIELAAFGGFTYREGRKLKLWEEFLIVLNGPVAGFLIFLAALAIVKTTTITNPTLHFLVYFALKANLFWTIVNLLPILPLDGGHLMSIFLESLFGFKGVKAAIIVGLVVGAAICIFFLSIGAFLAAALFLLLLLESFRSLRYFKIYSEKDRDLDLQKLMKEADEEFQSGSRESALGKLQKVREQTKGGILYTMATQEMAKIYKERGEYKEAYEMLYPIQSSLSGEELALFHSLAFYNRDYPTVAKVGIKCFQDQPSYSTAEINALAHAALGETEPAIGWFECAIREGLPSSQELLQREEFNKIRHDEKFRLFERNQVEKELQG
jgi:stage IV sporulation protein FB